MRVNTMIAAGLFLCMILFIMPGLNHGLWLPDETRVAGICSEMARSGNYIVPQINGRPFLEKPPLYYAVAGLAGFLINVDNELPYRFISLLFGILTIITTYHIASHMHGRWTGLAAAGILASSWGFFRLSRWLLVDIALVFGFTLTMYAYLELRKRYSPLFPALLGLGIGISFMTKGLVGPAMAVTAILIDIILRRDWKLIGGIKIFWVISMIFAMITPWVIALYAHGGWPYIREVIVVNNIMRFTGAPEGAALGHQHGILYYLDMFPRNILPWVFLFIPSFVSSIRNYKTDPYLGLVTGPLFLLSIASTKRGIYLVPLCPVTACMIASWLTGFMHTRWESTMVRLTWAVVVIGCFIPFSGIFLGKALLGICMGTVSVLCLYLFGIKRVAFIPKPLHIIIVAYICMTATMTVYFAYSKPCNDLADFTREALEIAGDEKIHTIYGDELFECIIPILGKQMHCVNRSDQSDTGLYIYTTREHRDIFPFPQIQVVQILLEREFGNRRAILAKARPVRG